MNICYQLPVHLYDFQFYEKLKEKVEGNYKRECCGVLDCCHKMIVPKKSGRCILVERGTSIAIMH